ncbi:hypothetical protein Lepto7375DRAFT_7229 [Leptolyngbya sp. PCC 7375]|nr:hypothetical protein Lepto7375DRAFT_7229 [Leptolyngbya sp. PCC 7375]
MIVYTKELQLSIDYDRLYGYLKSITVMPYQPFKCGYNHTYELKSLPDFRLLEGVIVPPHSDGITGYRPILMLHNPGNSYTIRGRDETGILYQLHGPQKPGDLIILDIEAQHEVRSKNPLTNFGPWAGLVWGHEGLPWPKGTWSPEDIANRAAQEFEKLLENRYEL